MEKARRGSWYGSRIASTPWGEADDWQDHLISPSGKPVLSFVSSPSHGGAKLQKAAKELLPFKTRKLWFEEDAEAALIRVIFAEWLVESEIYTPAEGWEKFQEWNIESLARYYPDWLEALYNRYGKDLSGINPALAAWDKTL